MEVVAAAPAGAAGDARAPFRDRDVREWARVDAITGALEQARLETDTWSASTATACHHYGKVVDSRARTEAGGAVRQVARRQLEVFQSRVPGGHLRVVRAAASSVSSGRWPAGARPDANGLGAADFENLQLSLNPLDLSSQKSKASVGRSASRRPPTRSTRQREPPADGVRDPHYAAAANLHRVSRLCHQIHESAVRQAFGRRSPLPERQSGDGSVSGVEIREIETSDDGRRSGLARTKSTSSDDVHQLADKDSRGVEDLEDLEQLQNWRRTSKIRRSLQFPKQNQATSAKPPDIPENTGSVRKIKEDLEKGRRLNTALRNNSVDLEALDQILQSISNSDKTSTDDNLDDDEHTQVSAKSKQKRDSFVTVETLQEVKCRLRRTSSPSNDIYKNEETDDGIVTEDVSSEKSSPKSRVRSYVFGMEAMLNKKPVLGTGSLESKSKLVNGNSVNRNEDWYNRRKSYGFEQVHNHDDAAGSFSAKNKNVVESSTDSGICRSSEIVLVPPATKTNPEERYNSDNSSDGDAAKHSYEKLNQNGLVRKMSSIFDNKDEKKQEYSWNRREWNDVKSTTITIPIVKNNNAADLSWEDEPERDVKRHSIAVDESKYVTKPAEPKFRRTSLAGEQLADDDGAGGRKAKKVGFCKTEVHFAADSGKVNIVETDEKPPPTQNFRRRRRNSGPITNFNEDFNRNGLPMLHFGDTAYEKSMFGVEEDDVKDEAIYENLTSRTPPAFGTVTITNGNSIEFQEEEKKEADNENIKGILKNKPIKPKPYHLGETVPFATNSEEEGKKWSLNLRPAEREEPPVWKSTVTVRNPYFEDDQPEFQKLLRNLRPTKKFDYLSDEGNRPENRHSDSFSNIRILPPAVDNRRSSWSVTDKVKVNDESTETKGYSTKVNFGDGEATVVETDRHPTWPRTENITKGREDSSSKHTMCSKMTTTQENNNTTTTTKITIDLSPSPDTVRAKEPEFKYAKYQRSQNARFKSTSLILNTIKDKEAKSLTDAIDERKYYSRSLVSNKIPQQLEALKKMYEDAHSDSDADKEVQQLMSKHEDNDKREDDNNSVVSGSWSKMTAYNHINEANRGSFRKAISRFDLKYNAKVEKDTAQLLNPIDGLRAQQATNKTSNSTNVNLNKSKYSPVGLRKPTSVTRTDLKPSVTPENISSPLLVCKSPSNDYDKHEPVENDKEFRNVTDTKLQNKHVIESVVLRQPRKSEMTYFGVSVSPKPTKKISQAVIRKETSLSSEKPDLLQHHKRQSSPSNKKVARPSKYSPDVTRRSNSPIYENLKPAKTTARNKYGPAKEFDKGILEELTKAADQILQAVNGYTDEETNNRASTDDDQPKKKLDTISETKAWKNKEERRKGTTTKTNTKTRVNRTSSTSSVESVTKERRRSTPEAKPAKTTIEKPKKKVSSDSSTSKANTRARRLQRASSREALLQSHGSSSEDISTHVEAPVRKPRLIKKTKLTQLTMTNGLELKKPLTNDSSKRNSDDTIHSRADERILGSLPEIRHKTAVSTIRSTAEKTKERSKHRTDDSRRKTPVNKDHLNRGLHSTTRTPPDKTSSCSRNTTTKTTTHKISTANIKKCQRTEGGTKH